MDQLLCCRDHLLCCRGQFFEYTDPHKLPAVKERTWERWDFHYDDLASAMLTLFAAYVQYIAL